MGAIGFIYSILGQFAKGCLVMTMREKLRGKRLSPLERRAVFALRHGCVTVAEVAESQGISQGAARGMLWLACAKAGAIDLADLVLMATGRKAGAVDLGVSDGTG